MSTTELFVSLKMPDNTAITAFHTLGRMGYKQLKKVERLDYYKFEFTGNIKNFQDKISSVDILVNSNKHKCSFDLEKYDRKIKVLVQNLGIEKGLLSILKTRLEFKNIKKVKKGILWVLSINADKEEAKEIAVKITKDLLMNENYQKMVMLK